MLNDISPKIESYGTPRFRSSHFPIRTRCLPTYCIAIIKKYFWREFDKDIQNCWTSFQFLSLQLRILILSLELSARNTFSILHQFDFQIFFNQIICDKTKDLYKKQKQQPIGIDTRFHPYHTRFHLYHTCFHFLHPDGTNVMLCYEKDCQEK